MPLKKIFKNEEGKWVGQINSAMKVRAQKTFETYEEAEKWAEEAYWIQYDLVTDTL